jgi:lycopene beta-cyclase
MVTVAPDVDYALVGGGLQNALIALCLLERQPQARICLIERSATLGGNHLWCFHAGDVPESARAVIDSLVVRRWADYEVLFPGSRRVVDDEYAAVSSSRLHDVVSSKLAQAPSATLLLDTSVAKVANDHVELGDGRTVHARVVIDARGPERLLPPSAAYQKFVGLELEIEPSAAFERPRLMDARVPQRDGFRFVYVLPFAPDRVLIEDTYFSDSPDLDQTRLCTEISRYAERHGLQVRSVVRRESGVLPLPLQADLQFSQDSPLVAGYAGGFFHPTTGYSLPVALRLARHVASRSTTTLFTDGWQRLLDRQRRQASFGMLLNRLLFSACLPEDRWRILARFYALPAPLIRRFYALDTSAIDRARIICGRPPRGVSLRLALTRGMAP